MSNTRKVPGDPNVGLVEAFLEDGKVALQLFPPGREPVIVRMHPQMARELGGSLIDGAITLEKEAAADARSERPR